MIWALKAHLPLVFLLLILSGYLVVKALPENSWDGWRVGSAQTLLSNKHWVKDGFFTNRFLFLPQGYSKLVHYFDDLELRHHARGIATGGLIGKRLHYTHYPSGYLIPTALLIKLGVENRFWLRLLEIFISLGTLILLYIALNLISGDKLIAFFGILFYSLSTLFLDYADTLANQPLDELLRLVIIVLSLLAIKNEKKHFNWLIWIFYFLLAISSYDSIFFVLAWLIGLDLIIQKKIRWKQWFLWALAPVLAFGLQMFQNISYLGWRDTILDLYGTFKVQILGSRQDFFITHIKRLIEPFAWFFGFRWYLGILIAGFGLMIFKAFKKIEGASEIKYLYLSGLAAVFHFLVFPSLFFYQARLLSLFGGLLTGGLTIWLIRNLSSKNLKLLPIIVLIFTIGLWASQIKITSAYIKNWPNNIWPAESIEFAYKVKNLGNNNKVIFQINETEKNVSDIDRYPKAASEDEYYLDAPILGFTSISDFTRDFDYLRKRSEIDWSAIIISENENTLLKIQKNLNSRQPIIRVQDKFVLVIEKIKGSSQLP